MTNYEKLEKVLTELFQLDKAELDFGIYRIMNQKRDDVLDFLKNKLPKEVRTILESQQKGDAVALKKELDNAIKMAKEFDLDPNTTPKVQEARAAYESAGSIEGLEQEVFSHLASFFKRYYEGGDFISLRRYKKDVYAIPYEGEEVKLHWANHDQYYIKTSENLKNYAFKIDGGKTVKFTLKEASAEQNNNKAEKDQERRFALYEEEPVTIEGSTIHLNFTYELYKKSVKQEKLIEKAIEKLTDNVPSDFAKIFSLAPTDKNKSRTLLEKHLKDFSARNTFDYFIHKDLGGFLTRELDFYIKNEVLFIDDINTDSEQAFTTQLSKIRALKQVASKVITFLAQLENFQKKLWLKKKIVVSSDYCITLDIIPDRYYTEIAKNKEQLEEWKVLFDVDIKKEEDLNQEPYLVLDTKFFSQDFKDKLLAEFNDLDEETNGILIKSDNFQALSLLSGQYEESISCIYIDPPYNTGDDGFNYKDNFKSSSWLTMMSQLNPLVLKFLNSFGAFFASCDENEALDYGQLLVSDFSKENLVETISWNKRIPKNDKGIGNIHEYIYLFCKDLSHRRSLEKTFTMRKDAIEEIYKLVDKLKRNKVPIAKAKIELKKYYKKQGFDRGITLYCELDPNYEIWGKINMSWPNAKTQGPRYDVMNPSTNELSPVPNRGWRWKEETLREAEKNGDEYLLPDSSIMKGKIWYSNNIKTQPSSITYLKDVESFLLRSIISLKSDGSIQLDNLGLSGTVDYPKPPKLMEWLFYSTGETSGYFLDFFGGSGTSSEAIINLNKLDNGNRKYILIDMGEHFRTALIPRTIKNIYSSNWKNGKPQDKNGVSQMFKYFNLESYEDCLNNLKLKPNQAQQQLLDTNSYMQEEYLLQYMLDVETRDQLLNIEAFKNPFNYKLNITENNELVPTNVDLVETFNYLIGLHVKRVQRIGAFKTVEGVTNAGDKVLVIWRNLEESNNDDLNIFVKKMDYNLRDGEFGTVYVNGDNNLANLRQDDEIWKVLLLEEVFFTLMFDVKDV
jgi:adenine-specific DNA-methyltransferase